MDSQYPVCSFPYTTCFSCLIAFEHLFLISIILVRNHESRETVSLTQNVAVPSFHASSSISSQVSSHGNVTLLHTFSMRVFERLREMEAQKRRHALEMLPAPVKLARDETSSLDECVVCLQDFHDGDSCRTFPSCKHIFHLSCIDEWLSNHVTCPICRDHVMDIPEV